MIEQWAYLWSGLAGIGAGVVQIALAVFLFCIVWKACFGQRGKRNRRRPEGCRKDTGLARALYESGAMEGGKR